MNRIILAILFSICILKFNIICSQPIVKSDTLRYKYLDNATDTSFCLVNYINDSTFIMQNFHGHKKGSRMTTRVDTFIVNTNKWMKVFNREIIPFLSSESFINKETTNEYFVRKQKDKFYYKYTPVKIIKVDSLDFYLYQVMPMSGNGMDESLGSGLFHIIFDFKIGEIYRSTFQEKKVLLGFEEYVKYFKW